MYSTVRIERYQEMLAQMLPRRSLLMRLDLLRLPLQWLRVSEAGSQVGLCHHHDMRSLQRHQLPHPLPLPLVCLLAPLLLS